ncbi:MAG: hybrid sensor histidine kinase/response regulator [Anaerolineae bacterium]
MSSPARPYVLYIEDDPLSRRLVSKVLANEFEVATAATGLEGLSLAQRRRPDLVLTDLNLPDLNGEYIAARLQTLIEPAVPVVAVTAQTTGDYVQRSLAAGCVGFVSKPIDISSFPDTVRAYLSGHKVDKLSSADAPSAVHALMLDMAQKLEGSARRVQEDHVELRQLERTKNTFLTQVAHELRTPLTVLSGYIQMLQTRLHEATEIGERYPDLLELGDQSADGIKRLHRLMNEIVVMARLSTNQLDTEKSIIRPAHIAQEVIEEFSEPASNRNINLMLHAQDMDAVFLGDPTLLPMLFSNLVSNALKFTPDGGTVAVQIDSFPEALYISVRDTGVGIAAESLPLLFKPFYSGIDVSRGRTSKTDFMGMGMGLGLTLIARIVEAHKGKVWAESPGYDEQKFPGSTFHVLLPVEVEA